MAHSNATKIMLCIIVKQFVKKACGTWHKSNSSSFFGLICGFNFPQIPRFCWGRRVTTFHTWLWVILFPIGRNVDSISHLFVNFSTNSSFCQSALGMGLYTEGHRSEWLHSEFSVFRSLPREFYIAIFRRSDTQSCHTPLESSDPQDSSEHCLKMGHPCQFWENSVKRYRNQIPYLISKGSNFHHSVKGLSVDQSEMFLL